MAMIDRNFTFATNGTVSAADLHNLIDSATIYQDLITGQVPITSVGINYELLIADATNPNAAPNAVTVYDLFDDALSVGTYTGLNLTGALTYGTATGTRLVSANATITTGTITTGVIPSLTAGTTTSTAATITSGTITNLASTTGTIATLNSTTGTIATGVIPTLTSTTLITTGTGTAATPAIVPTGDTNTGIFFPAADTLAATTNGTEHLRIDSSGNVGIGTNSPSVASGLGLVLNGGASQTRLAFKNTTTGDTSTDGVQFALVAASSSFIFQNRESDGNFAFETAGTERLRIDSSGNCSIGTATALSRLHVHGDLTLSNATTAVTASTSTITPPATVAGYLTVSINGTSRKIPYYAT